MITSRTLRFALVLLALSACSTQSQPSGTPTSQAVPSPVAASVVLLVTNSAGRHVSFVEPASGAVEQVEVGASPHGLALSADGRAYVATAEGVAVVDVRERQRLALVPYRASVGSPQFGEYRPGGMGIAVAPDGRQVYVGVYLPGGPSRLEILDVERQAIVDSVPVGIRPFQVLVSADGRSVFSIDHDSFTVTVVDPATLSARELSAAPLGRGAFDKPHYASLRTDGHLLLPYQGRVLAELDPSTGRVSTIPLTADTHQHGAALTPGEDALLIVGTGPAGGASRGPSLTILDLNSGSETILPLRRPHERVAVSPDGRFAYLTGGYLLANGGYLLANGGWDGLTIVDLQARTTRELPVPDRPLDIGVLP